MLLGALGGSLAGAQLVAQDTSGAAQRERDRAAMMGCGMMMGGGRMPGGPVGGRAPGDSAFASDMALVHELLLNHDAITRTVTLLPQGIRTLTESDNPQVAAYLIQHVARMEQRLKDGSLFNVASPTLPTIFEHKNRIRTDVQSTAKGVAVTQTSDDSATVAALQAHAAEVSALVAEGMVAMRRSMMAGSGTMHRMGMPCRMSGHGP